MSFRRRQVFKYIFEKGFYKEETGFHLERWSKIFILVARSEDFNTVDRWVKG